MDESCDQAEKPQDIDRKHARMQAACALHEARKLADGFTEAGDELTQIRTRLLIDIADQWRWLHSDLPY